MNKFKVGEEVICINTDIPIERGAGWSLGYSFVIKEYTTHYRDVQKGIPFVYWPTDSTYGVCEHALALKNRDWDE